MRDGKAVEGRPEDKHNVGDRESHKILKIMAAIKFTTLKSLFEGLHL